MNITLFAQITQTLDRISFGKLVSSRQTDKHQKSISRWTHFAITTTELLLPSVEAGISAGFPPTLAQASACAVHPLASALFINGNCGSPKRTLDRGIVCQ